MYIEKLEVLISESRDIKSVIEKAVILIRSIAPKDPIRARQYAAQDLADALNEVLIGLEISDRLRAFNRVSPIKINTRSLRFEDLAVVAKRQWNALAVLDREAA